MNSSESKFTPDILKGIVNSAVSAEKYYVTSLRNIVVDILGKSIDNQQRRDLLVDVTTIAVTKIIKLIQNNDSQNTTTKSHSFQSNVEFLKLRLTGVSKKIQLMNAAELFEIIQINKEHGPKAALDHISPLVEVPLYNIQVKSQKLGRLAIPLSNQESDQKN